MHTHSLSYWVSHTGMSGGGRNGVFRCSQALESDFLLHICFPLTAWSLLLLFKRGAHRLVMNALAISKFQRTGGFECMGLSFVGLCLHRFWLAP